MQPARDFSRFVFASGNPGKLREVRQIFGELDIEIVPQSDLGIDGVDETGQTFVENALLKARHAATLSGLPAIADDSGLVVDALGGRPGVRSARYAGEHANDRDNVNKLLDELRGIPPDERQASFHCAVVLVVPDGLEEPVISEAKWFGRILQAPLGSGGFGYDPVFFDDALGRGAAELSADEKNAVSHRGKAFRALLARLRLIMAG